MEKEAILMKMQEIFCDVFDNEEIVLTRDTTADDIDEWDSLSHIQLIVEIEKKFSVKLTSKEVHGLADVGEMVDTISSKLEN